MESSVQLSTPLTAGSPTATVSPGEGVINLACIIIACSGVKLLKGYLAVYTSGWMEDDNAPCNLEIVTFATLNHHA